MERALAREHMMTCVLKIVYDEIMTISLASERRTYSSQYSITHFTLHLNIYGERENVNAYILMGLSLTPIYTLGRLSDDVNTFRILLHN